MEQHITLAFAFFMIGKSISWGSKSIHSVDKEFVLSFTLVSKIIIIKITLTKLRYRSKWAYINRKYCKKQNANLKHKRGNRVWFRVKQMLQHTEYCRRVKRFGLYSTNSGILDKKEIEELITLSSFIQKIKLCIPYDNDAGAMLSGYPVVQEKGDGKEALTKYLRGKNYWLY